ncbi:EndoU domain-containing protein [Phormidium pseudopriestleyi FRX01]|uniref:EndoU domain-containing protein n=1 Tax=Phormidium pseudopriestleyi FRX01 TaxID=1759528 RepID=A0ABS3FXA8_9CYAN|nr:EndoU domain-containing protein [Phormidium pseudopriestleyi]MBO0351769.1 EndoU domain-containing protein [Phormidium pseudopriestleyi FRX01]
MNHRFGQLLNGRTIRPIGIGAVVCLLVAFLQGIAQGQSINCGSSSHWVTAYNQQQVNHAHIFCGEVNREGRVVGFHARPRGQNPSTVRQFRVTQSVDNQGIYGGEWSHTSGGGSKFSTMFPDRCTAEQVINSIAYAQANRVQCPNGAPNWAWCGLNAPTDSSQQTRFCPANNGSSYRIAGATNRDGKINTGFPLR